MMAADSQQELACAMAERNAAFIFRPIVSEQLDGSWRACYPGAEWSVTATSSTDATHKLHAAQLDRLTDPRSADWQLIALRQHLDHGPVPGVYEIPADRYQHITSSADPQAELNQLIRQLDAQRTAE